MFEVNPTTKRARPYSLKENDVIVKEKFTIILVTSDNESNVSYIVGHDKHLFSLFKEGLFDNPHTIEKMCHHLVH